MVRARCVRFIPGKGFGFLRRLDDPNAEDVFFHKSALGGDELEVGDLVDVEVVDNGRGPRAALLMRVEG